MYDGVHLYGVSGRKAYTESVLNILRKAGLIKTSPPPYYRRYHNLVTQSNQDTLNSEYVCPTQDTDWLNDRDTRYNRRKIKYKTELMPVRVSFCSLVVLMRIS